jgi:hypothetical protein
MMNSALQGTSRGLSTVASFGIKVVTLKGHVTVNKEVTLVCTSVGSCPE